MNEQITTVAELDALPVGSIAARICSDGQGNVAYSLTSEGWCMSTERINTPRISEYDQVGNHIGPLTVLYRPDTPERTEPTEEQVVEALMGTQLESADATVSSALALLRWAILPASVATDFHRTYGHPVTPDQVNPILKPHQRDARKAA